MADSPLIRSVHIGDDNPRPDYQIAIIDGQPERVLNKEMIRELARESPLGEAEALRRLKKMIPSVDWDSMP